MVKRKQRYRPIMEMEGFLNQLFHYEGQLARRGSVFNKINILYWGFVVKLREELS
jgi:hypothetical protein